MSDEVGHLLHEDCKSQEEQNLFIDLLTRSKYVCRKDYKDYIADIVRNITTCDEIEEDNTIIATTTSLLRGTGNNEH